MASTLTKPQRVYINISQDQRRKIYYNQTKSLQNKHYNNDTSLTSHVWKIKAETEQIKILIWPIVRTVVGYSNTTKKYALCRHDKFKILMYSNLAEFS